MSEQQSLFDGGTVNAAKDDARLSGQLKKVASLMADHEWRTLAEIHAIVGGSEAGISARLRDLRKPKFGSHFVERQRRQRGNNGPAPKSGLWEYRLSSGPTSWAGDTRE